MSHEATVWAHRQRQLTAPQWRILVILADRHNPDFGCFPRQVQIAADCNMSRSQVNVHLAALEEMGLIHRLRRVDRETGRQMSTRYILGFEQDFPQVAKKPCLEDRTRKNGESRVRFSENSESGQPDTKPVIEPVNTKHAREADSALVDLCLSACGSGLTDESRRAIRGTGWVIEEWVAAGCDLDQDVLPVLRALTGKPTRRVIRTFAYFTGAIEDRFRRRQRLRDAKGVAEKNSVSPGGVSVSPGGVSERPDPSEALNRLAEWINSDRYVPPSAVSSSQKHELLARGLVTQERLRARQIY